MPLPFPKSQVILGYRDLFGKEPLPDRISLLRGMCRHVVMGELARLNYALKPKFKMHADTSFETQNEELFYMCGSNRLLFDKYVKLLAPFRAPKNDIPILFTRQACLFAMEEIIQSDLLPIDGFKMGHSWDNLVQYYLAINSVITRFGNECEDGDIQTKNPPSFEELNRRTFVLNELSVSTDPIFLVYRGYRLLEFTRVDPLCDSFPANSPYAFSENKVTGNVELEGLETATIQDVWRSGGITESYGNQIANSVSRTMVKAGRMSADALIIVGGVVILVASDGAATPLFIIASGDLAIAGGTAKLILDAQGKYEQSDETPSTVSGTAIYTINEAVGPDKHGNKVFSKEFQATVEFVVGVATLKIAGFEKMSNVDQMNAVISTVNLLISSKDIPDNVKAMLKKGLMTNLNTITNPPPAGDHPEDEHWKHAIPNIPQMK